MTSPSSPSRPPQATARDRNPGGVDADRAGRGRAGDSGTNVRARPLRVWCLIRDQRAHVRSVEQFLGAAARFTYDADWDAAALSDAGPDIVVCVNDWPYDVARCLDVARSQGIPSLVLQDGILEWRCQYRNPLFGAGGGAPQHQPVLADKIACIGAQSARQIARWGNAEKVEVTGMPRLDPLLDRIVRPPDRPGSRVLVMTAKNPGFDRAQRETTLRSLRALKACLERIDGIEVAWRISRGLVPELGIDNRLVELGGTDLLEQIEWADAVVTTPSTVMLESMLLGRPVAALDFHNVPRFVPTAWTISAPEHASSVIRGILEPSARRMAFQRDCLVDCLRCDGPAAPRVAALMESMATEGPTVSLSGDDARRRPPGAGFVRRATPALGALYPDRAVFAVDDPRELQARLARAEKEIQRLRKAAGARSSVHRLFSIVRRFVRRS